MADPAAHPFEHEKMQVYQKTLEFHALAFDVATQLPRGKTNLKEQLESAATSITLNLAEGAGEYSRKEKVRLYRMALRSASECAALLDIARITRAAREERTANGKILLHEITAMLLALIHHHERAASAHSPSSSPSSSSSASSSVSSSSTSSAAGPVPTPGT